MKSFFDGIKNAVEALSDVDNVKAAFKELKEGVSEDVKELLATKHAAVINGHCPLCQKETGFREPSFTEDVATVGKFAAGSAGQFVGGGIQGKAEVFSKLAGSGDGRKFPSYVCLSCQGRVMQCSGCNEVVPYSDTADAHACGTGTPKLERAPVPTSQPAQADQTEDLISKLERLGALKERGLLTADEFEAQKRKLLG